MVQATVMTFPIEPYVASLVVGPVGRAEALTPSIDPEILETQRRLFEIIASL